MCGRRLVTSGLLILTLAALPFQRSFARGQSERVVLSRTSAGWDGLPLIGSYHRNRGWLCDWQAARLVPAHLRFQTITMQGVGRTLTIQGRPRIGEIGFGYYMKARGHGTKEALALAGAVNPVPRRARLCRDRAIARALVASALRTRKVEVPNPRVVAAWEVDLDGDGRLELLVHARSRDELLDDTVKGDYAIAVVGHQAAGRWRWRTLHAFVALNEESTEEEEMLTEDGVLAVADIDGDGGMEIVLDKQASCGSGFEVLAFRSGKLRRLFAQWWGG